MIESNRTVGQSLSRNEHAEADAFDRVAGNVDRNTLRATEDTFLRYRNATIGNPIQQRHPDLMFALMGNMFRSDRKPQAKPLHGIRVLDLGAGDGSWSVILAEQGADVVSVEISPRQVELARERMAINNLFWDARIGSAFALQNDFEPACFDLIFGQGVLHHLTFDLHRVYQGCSDLLKAGGYAIFSEPVTGGAFLRALRKQLAWMIPLDSESPDERPLFPSEIKMLNQYFAKVDVSYFDVFAKISRRISGMTSLGQSLTHLDDWLLKNNMFVSLATMAFIVARR
jgi:2-polyprenyl-3-methyl-5-hydroxy-6-metoxy-1,4-benzoquinol methylase